MEYVIAVLLAIVFLELRRIRTISNQLADVQVRLFHIEKNLVETREQVEALPKQRND